MATSLLIVDDEPKMSGVLARMLSRDGYAVQWSDDPLKALQLLENQPFDIILCDLRMPGLTGIDLLERAKKLNPGIDFVMMTAYATPQTAVESMKKGAIDYLIKPFSIDELRALIKRIEETRAGRFDDLPEESPLAAAPLPPHPGRQRPTATSPVSPATPSSPSPATPQPAALTGIIAESPEMQEVLGRIKKVAASDASVLLRGESGTGKEVIAQAIHRLSPRADKALISVNCGAIPENLMESELFGHIKGSFTGALENRKGLFESADGGTIFLDEIGEVPPYLQVKLLRVLQEGEIQRVGESIQRPVDVRVIAATNRNLEEDVSRGMFRQDLYYRLNVIPISLPALRDRRADIQPLIQHFLQRFGGPSHRVSPIAMQRLLSYDFPGNIRELENAIEHAVVLSDDQEIQSADLPLQVQTHGGANANSLAPASHAPAGTMSASSHLEEIEKRCIMEALEKTRYNFTRAAEHLGITRRTLGYRIHKYGLDDDIQRQKAAVRGELSH